MQLSPNQTPTNKDQDNKTFPEQTKFSTPVEQTWTQKVTINTLLGGIKKENKDNTTNNSGEVSYVQQKRFVSVKYKMYTLFIVTALIVLYGPVSDAAIASWDKWERANTIAQTTTMRLKSQEEYVIKTDTIKSIQEKQDIVVSCINDQDKCDQLPENINIDVAKAYIQIGSLNKEKMKVNESKILKNINEFITRDESYTDEIRYNWTVTNILIDEPKDIENKMIQVPITLTITFNNKENLIKFLHNIENRVFYDTKDGLNDSILYRIDELKYDIVNYKETQDVEVILSAYAYNE